MKTGIKFGNVELDKFITVASGPLTDKFSKIEAAEKAGVGAVSLKLTFVNVPFASQMRSYSLPGSVIISPTNKRLDLKKALEIIKEIKEKLSIRLFVNYTAAGDDLDSWALLSEKLTAAGADILEPNFCCPNISASSPAVQKNKSHGGASIAESPETCANILKRVKSASGIPLVPKIICGTTRSLAETARSMEACGIDGIHAVGTPISGLPPVSETGAPDIPLLEGIAPGSTNGTVCKYNSFLCAAVLAQVVKVPIMISGGLETWKDCVDVIHWGATAPSICSAYMWHGYEITSGINRGIEDFMKRNNYSSIHDFRGKALKHFTTPDKVVIKEGWAVIDDKKCVKCGRCMKPSHCEAISRKDNRIVVDEKLCIGCGVCRNLCPKGAISYIGR